MSNVKTVSAKEVRDFLKANRELVTDDTLWVNIDGRGRLHPRVIAIFQKAKRSKVKYEVGLRDNKTVTITGPRNKQFRVQTADLREFLGQPTNTRGRFSAVDKERYINEVLLAA